MFNCSDVSQKVSESMDRDLPFHQQMMIRLHLQMCKYCKRFRDQLLLIRKAIRAELDSDMEPATAKSGFTEVAKRIKQTLRQELSQKSD